MKPQPDRQLRPQAHLQASAPILVVGDIEGWGSGADFDATANGLILADFWEVSTQLLALHMPTAVFSPLVSRNFDCVDLALTLTELGFRGRYRAICPDLPNPDLIRAEIQGFCPGLDFDLIYLAAPDSALRH